MLHAIPTTFYGLSKVFHFYLYSYRKCVQKMFQAGGVGTFGKCAFPVHPGAL